jgi:hypothetical protein
MAPEDKILLNTTGQEISRIPESAPNEYDMQVGAGQGDYRWTTTHPKKAVHGQQKEVRGQSYAEYKSNKKGNKPNPNQRKGGGKDARIINQLIKYKFYKRPDRKGLQKWPPNLYLPKSNRLGEEGYRLCEKVWRI